MGRLEGRMAIVTDASAFVTGLASCKLNRKLGEDI